MRHRDARNRLKQKPAHARMIKRNLLTSILLYENVRTTESRAKAVAPMVDRIIRNAKKQVPHNAIRAINELVTDKNACRKVMEVLIKRYEKRPSGLTRIVPVGERKGDGARLVDFSLVDSEVTTSAPAVTTSSNDNNEN
jgi:large subunit ribosomal protein L17